MKHQEKIQWMINWCHKNKARLELEGECGLGRECVGIIIEGHYPDYEWRDQKNYERIDNNGNVWIPKDAYHKHECVAVLGRGKIAESQLYDWLKWFDDNNFKLETGNNDPKEWKHLGTIALIMNKHRYARMVKKGKPNA